MYKEQLIDALEDSEGGGKRGKEKSSSKHSKEKILLSLDMVEGKEMHLSLRVSPDEYKNIQGNQS